MILSYGLIFKKKKHFEGMCRHAGKTWQALSLKKKKQKKNRINSTDYLVAKDKKKKKEMPMLSEVAQNFLSEIKGGKKEEAVRHT